MHARTGRRADVDDCFVEEGGRDTSTLTHSLALPHPLTHAHAYTHTLTRTFVHSHTSPPAHSLTHALTYSHLHSLEQALMCAYTPLRDGFSGHQSHLSSLK